MNVAELIEALTKIPSHLRVTDHNGKLLESVEIGKPDSENFACLYFISLNAINRAARRLNRSKP